MAEKRMFTKKITDDDNFVSLPSSAQALYFHLNQGADDDGFNNQLSIAKFKAHADDTDLKLLEDKRYIIKFDNNVVVIKHWKMHNSIRKDRHQPTVFQEQYKLLNIKDNEVYTLDRQMTDKCQTDDRQVTDKCPHRLDEIRLVESSVEECSVVEEETTPSTPTLAEITEYVFNNNLSVNPNRFFSYYNDRDWKTSNGKPIKWEQKLEEWDFEDKQKAKANAKAETHTSSNPFLELAKEENLF